MDAGHALWELGRYREAIGMYTEALRVAPADSRIAGELAWALATCPDDTVRDGGHALAIAGELSERAQDRDPRLLDILAAAQAETGDFDAASATGERAAGIVERTLSERGAADPREAVEARAFLGEVRQRIALYRSERPYRQP